MSRIRPERASAAVLALLALLAACVGQHLATTSVSPTVETDPVPSSGDAADDAAIWVHPTEPELSLVIGTDKRSGLAVYDLGGRELQFLAEGRFNNVDLRYHFALGGEEVALVASGERSRNALAVYAVDPGTRSLRNVAARAIPLQNEVYGCCLYQSRATGDIYFFATTKGGFVEQWRLFDDGAGRVDAEFVRTLAVGGKTEGCVADDENAALFVSEEDVGIWRYDAEPGGGDARIQIDTTGKGGHLTSDVEGLALYYAAGGRGYLIASSQGSDTFAVYERGAPYRHVLDFAIGDNSVLAIDAVSTTDGIEVTNLGLGHAFPGGLFIAQDDSNRGGKQNFKLVPWTEIAAAARPALLVDDAYDALGARGRSERARGPSSSANATAH